MTKEQFSDALTKLLAENDINVNDAMHVLISHVVTIALATPFAWRVTHDASRVSR